MNKRSAKSQFVQKYFTEQGSRKVEEIEKELLEAIEKDWWIRCDFALPENCTPVICFWGSYHSPEELEFTIEDLTDDAGIILEQCIGVTHWMPLPSPPKQ